MSPRKPTGRPTGRPPKDLEYHLIGEFILTFEQAKAGIDRAERSLSDNEYRNYINRLMQRGPDEVEIVEIDARGKRRRLRPDEYPCMRRRR